MVEVDPDPDEAARRLRSALAYVGLSQTEAAKAMGVSIATLARMLGRKGSDGVRPATWSELWRAADALGLPRAWFTADITKIHTIVPDELPSFPNDTGDVRVVSPAMRAAAADRFAQALAVEAQRADVRQQAARDTKRGRRRRRDEGS
jgi:transcriptional regulator with XRE-family HTH domain